MANRVVLSGLHLQTQNRPRFLVAASGKCRLNRCHPLVLVVVTLSSNAPQCQWCKAQRSTPTRTHVATTRSRCPTCFPLTLSRAPRPLLVLLLLLQEARNQLARAVLEATPTWQLPAKERGTTQVRTPPAPCRIPLLLLLLLMVQLTLMPQLLYLLHQRQLQQTQLHLPQALAIMMLPLRAGRLLVVRPPLQVLGLRVALQSETCNERRGGHGESSSTTGSLRCANLRRVNQVPPQPTASGNNLTRAPLSNELRSDLDRDPQAVHN